MTTTAPHEIPDTRTSAVGCMHGSSLGATFAAVPIAILLPGPATANTYAQGSMAIGAMVAPFSERTAAGPAGQVEHKPVESTAEAIMEIHRRSGLTWEELGDLFDVSRRDRKSVV